MRVAWWSDPTAVKVGTFFHSHGGPLTLPPSLKKKSVKKQPKEKTTFKWSETSELVTDFLSCRWWLPGHYVVPKRNAVTIQVWLVSMDALQVFTSSFQVFTEYTFLYVYKRFLRLIVRFLRFDQSSWILSDLGMKPDFSKKTFLERGKVLRVG